MCVVVDGGCAISLESEVNSEPTKQSECVFANKSGINWFRNTHRNWIIFTNDIRPRTPNSFDW